MEENKEGFSLSKWGPFAAVSEKIRNKIMVISAGLIIGTLVVAIVSLFTMNMAKNTVYSLVETDGKVTELAAEIEDSMRKAHTRDQDFMLNYKDIGFENAKSFYQADVEKNVDTALELLAQMVKIKPTEEITREAEKVSTLAAEYKQSFINIIWLLERKGFIDSGLIAELDQITQTIEESVKGSGANELQLTMRQLRDNEKNYLLNKGEDNIKATNAGAIALKEQLTSSELSEDAKDRNSKLMNDYMLKFAEIVSIDDEISSEQGQYRSALDKVEPALVTVVDQARGSMENNIAAMQVTFERAFFGLLTITGITFIIGLLSAFFFSRSLTVQIDKIMEMFSGIGIGDYSARAEVVSQDELGEMAESMNAMLDNTLTLIQSREERDSIQDSIMNLMEDISALTEGDLTGRAEVTEDITGAIADSFNTMADQFSDIIKKVKTATAAVDVTSGDVTGKTVQLAEKSTAQAESLNEAIGAIGKLVSSIKEVSDNALQSAEVSDQSKNSAREGAQAVQETNLAMDEIREQINETARSIKRLGESSMEIGNVVQIINDIADRTSILALNASIQAAMAGDAGHGFGVVAEEVQRLAESSSNSTKQIDVLVKSIQTEIKDVANRMDESISRVVQGAKLADNAHEKLQDIESVSNQLASLIQSITQAATHQAEVSETIAASMQSVGQVSKETSIASQDTATSMDSLSKTARALRDSVEMFKVPSAETA